MTKTRRLVAEGLGTALLTAVVIGSGMMAEQLTDGNQAISLLANAIATGCGLSAIVLMLGPISGAHFNPVLTLAEAWQGRMSASEVMPYITVQIIGAFTGVGATHLMFRAPIFFASSHARTGPEQWWSEFVATFGLLGVVIGCTRSRPAVTPFAVGAYITAAFWFTSSSSFANPAMTLAKAASNTFAGIRASDTPGFIIAQIFGAAAATMLFCWLYSAEKVVVGMAEVAEHENTNLATLARPKPCRYYSPQEKHDF